MRYYKIMYLCQGVKMKKTNGKYWDIIPPKKVKKFKPNPLQEDILKKLLESNGNIVNVPFTYKRDPRCLHNSCHKCHGSGSTPWGPCIHMISCPYPCCTPQMSISTFTVKGVDSVGKQYDPKTYKLLDKETIKLYNPRVVSTRRRVISA